MASNIIEVSPLPPGTTSEQVRTVFQLYNLEKVTVVDDKAYVMFNDVGQVQTLDFTFTDFKVSQLNNAQINPVLGQFSWPDPQSSPKIQEITQSQVTHAEEKKPSKAQIKPEFIVVNKCNKYSLMRRTSTAIKNQIFGKYQIGQIQKLNEELYVEFLDENQIELLPNQFENCLIPALGAEAEIGRVDKPFDIEKIRQLRIQEEAELQRQRQEKKKQEMKLRKMKEEQSIKEQLERSKKTQQIQKRESQEENKKTSAIPPPSKPKVQEREMKEEKIKASSSKMKLPLNPVSINHLWSIIIISWGLYILSS